MKHSSKALAIVHHGADDVGVAEKLLAKAGVALDVCCPLEGDALPEALDAYAGVIVFGGAMSANDDHLDGIRDELEWIGKVVNRDEVPVLGICLGAQLIARAGGARVTHHDAGEWEIGYFPVRFLGNDRNFERDEPFHVYQWHCEGFDVPAGSTLVAAGDAYPNQAFRIGGQTYGLQFHPEVTAEVFQTWMDVSPGFEERAGAQHRDLHFEGAQRHTKAIHTWLEQFLTGWLQPESRLRDTVSTFREA